MSKKRAQPLIHRSGGGSDLGFPSWVDGDTVVPRAKHILLRGAWKARIDEDVNAYLIGLKWTDVRVTFKLRGTWHLMAIPSPWDLLVSSWKYQLEG